MTTTYIVLVNWNGRRDTIECLDLLTRLDADDFAVIVVDNGSTDDTIGGLRIWATGLVPANPTLIVAHDGVIWPTASMNGVMIRRCCVGSYETHGVGQRSMFVTLSHVGEYFMTVPTTRVATRVAAIILNWRRPQDTLTCVRSVAAADHDLLDIIVCDNDSGDGSFDTIATSLRNELAAINAERAARGFTPFSLSLVPTESTSRTARVDGDATVFVVQTGRNGGYAFGNNVGIKFALLDPTTSFVFILNNDTVIDSAAIQHLIRKMLYEPCVGLCGCQVLYLGDRDSVQTLGGGHFLPYRGRAEQIGSGLARGSLPSVSWVESQLDYVNGAAAFARREALERGGLMDEGYFLYWEEIDWAMQVRAAGYRLGYCEDAIVYHEVGATTGADDGGAVSPMYIYYMTRNRVRYLARKQPVWLLTAIPLSVRDLVRELLRRRWDLADAILRGAAAAVTRR